jgi:hypothetical protein
MASKDPRPAAAARAPRAAAVAAAAAIAADAAAGRKSCGGASRQEGAKRGREVDPDAEGPQENRKRPHLVGACLTGMNSHALIPPCHLPRLGMFKVVHAEDLVKPCLLPFRHWHAPHHWTAMGHKAFQHHQ